MEKFTLKAKCYTMREMVEISFDYEGYKTVNAIAVLLSKFVNYWMNKNLFVKIIEIYILDEKGNKVWNYD